MLSRGSGLLAIALMLMLTLSCILVTDDTDCEAASDYDKGSYEFGDTTGVESANRINTLVGVKVCEYSNYELKFTRSVILTSATLTDKGMFVFSSMVDQFLTIPEGVTVTLHYNARITGSENHAAIESLYNLELNGKGTLKIIIDTNTYSDKLSGILCDGRLFVRVHLNIGPEGTSCNYFAGILERSNYLRITDINGLVTGRDYGVYMTYSSAGTVHLFYTNIQLSGGIKAFGLNDDKCSLYYQGGDVIGSDNPDGTDSFGIGSGDIFKYRYVKTNSSVDSSITLVYAFGACAAFIAGGFFVMWLVRKLFKKGFGLGGTGTHTTNWDSVIGDKTEEERVSDIMGVVTPDLDQVTVITPLHDQTFAAYVDGFLSGYITDTESQISVPPGDHELVITFNDVSGRTVYRGKINVADCSRITVDRTSTGYRVSKK